MIHEADYQGWTNWETWNVYVALDNEQESHNAMRKLVADGGTPQDLEQFSVETYIGPHNKQAIEEAYDYNSVPQEERMDYGYQELLDKMGVEDISEASESEQALHNLFGLGPDIEDIEPMLVDPNMVNWQELHTRIAQDVWENEAYETPDQFNDEVNPYIQQPEPPSEWLSSVHGSLTEKWGVKPKKAKYRDQIETIADAYDNMPEYDEQAAQAWKALAADSAQRANAFREAYNVGITDDPEPYDNAEQMFEDIGQGNFVVSRANSDHPIWTPDENVDFRIVHDILGHYPTGGDFSWHGENDACNAHAMKLADPEARKALMTECLGQTGSAIKNGGFGDQKVGYLEGYEQPWDWQLMQALSRNSENQQCCHRNLRNGGWPPVEEEISIHSALGDKVKRNVKKILPSERKRLKENPVLSDYPDHRQWKVNVGETNAEQLVKWLNQYRPDLIAPTVDMEGMWEGEREPSGQAQVINATKDEIEELLKSYGYDHPTEEAIGILPEGVGDRNTVLWRNPYHKVEVETDPPVSPSRRPILPKGVKDPSEDG
jgi:hypothetical protein